MRERNFVGIFDRSLVIFRQNLAIYLTVGFITFGLGTLFVSLFSPKEALGDIPSLAAALVYLPAVLLTLIGYLTITTLVLRPGTNVAEAFATGFRRLPVAIGVIMTGGLFFVVMAVVVGIFMGGQDIKSNPQTMSIFMFVMLIFAMWCSVRLIYIWPVMVSIQAGAFSVLRQSFAETRGRFWILAPLFAFASLLQITIILAVQFAGGSVLLMLGTAFGSKQIGYDLTSVLVSAATATAGVFWTIFVACLYQSDPG